MKIILSHDVDHLQGLEHWRDRYWLGIWYRGVKSLARGNIGFSTFIKRAKPWQRLERIQEVLELDRSYGATPTFFIGMSKGLRLSYSVVSAQRFIQYLTENEVPVGVHGMAYDVQHKMQKEYLRFCDLAGRVPAGIRNHYLRRSYNTINYMSSLGYRFDSTTYELKAPYKVNGMWEFPISLMDVSLGIDTSLSYKMEETRKVVERALEVGLPFFVVNVHDVYISDAYPSMKAWYNWVLKLLERNYDFITFESAISVLNEQ